MTPKKSIQKHWQASVLMIAIFVSACTSQAVRVTPSSNNFPTSTYALKTGTPTPTQTLRPTQTITVTPTSDIITALALEFDIPAVCLFTNTYLVSKDRNWIAVDCKLNRELIIANKLTGIKIAIAFLELHDEAQDYFSIRPLSWSSDNRYFYFTTSCCEPYETANRNGSLYRFNTEKESWDVLIRAVYDPYYFFFGQRRPFGIYQSLSI